MLEGNNSAAAVQADLRDVRRRRPFIGGSCPALWVHRGGEHHHISLLPGPGSTLHAVAGQGVPIRDLAAVIDHHLNLPTASLPAEDFGFLGTLLAADQPASSALTRELLRCGRLVQPGLIETPEEGTTSRTHPDDRPRQQKAFRFLFVNGPPVNSLRLRRRRERW